MIRSAMFATVLTAAALCACSPKPTANTTVIVNEYRNAVTPETQDWDARILDAATLSDADRLGRREWVADEEQRWRDFADIRDKRRQRIERPMLYRGEQPDRRRYLIGIADAVTALETCLEADAAWVEAWSELGHLRLAMGDRLEARICLTRALKAAAVVGPAERETMLRTHHDLAWTLRELALHEEGLAAVAAGVEEFGLDEDFLLIRGLLLADAGRLDEAFLVAADLPRRRIRYSDPRNRNFGDEEMAWPRRWVRSQALLASGDPEAAYRELGEVADDQDVDPYDLNGQGWKIGMGAVFDHERRFWNDVGLVAEMVGDPSSIDFYVASFQDRFLGPYYPRAADIRQPLVLGIPDGRSPSVTSFGHGNYVGGSPWGYVALQMDLMALALFPAQREKAADEALAMLDVLDRRGLRTDINAALRGRVLFRQERLDEARVHLIAARESFHARGESDARTSLLLGLIDLDRQSFPSAAAFLEESIRVDDQVAVAWRMLGVAYANLDRTDEAMEAMDHALAMETHSLAGFYNRGLLKLQLRECSAAAVDLDRAWRLDPENEEIRRLLQTAAACTRAQADGEEETVPVVRAVGAGSLLPVPSTEMLLEHLEADLEDFFTMQADTAAVVPAHADRTTRAVACVDRADFACARDLLADRWGVDLTPLEEVVLLEAERRLGEEERVSGLVADALAGDVATTNPYVWTIMLDQVRGAPDRWGDEAADRLLARLLDHAAEFSGRTVREWAQALRRELEEARG